MIDIAKTFIGLVTTMTENYRDSGSLLIRNSDIKEGQFVFSENPIHLDEEFAKKNKTRRLQIGDVVTVHTGNIGTSAVIEEKEAGAIGFATINTRTDKSILNPYFLATYFNTEKHKCYANSVSTGDGRSNYNIKDFNKLVISVPTLDEQERISVLINDMNTIITLHQRKLEKLKLAKKALLQKLFPKNGSQFPEIRFKGFTDAWEQRKLGDLLILLKDGSHGTHKNTDVGVYLLSAKNIKNGQINIMPDDRIISWEDYDVIHKNYELQFGDILLTIVGSIGETAIYNLKTKVTFQRSVAFLRPSSDLNNGFLYTLINTNRFQNQLQTKQVVSAQPGIYLGDLASIDITYPKNLSEQEKIYSIFKEIENSITLHQRKLDKLQEVKKGLLQKMFV